MQIGEYRCEFDLKEKVGVTVRRDVLDSFLARQAEKAGATLWTSAAVSEVAESEGSVQITTAMGPAEGKIMIVAEGATSRSARKLFGDYPKEQLAMGVATNVSFRFRRWRCHRDPSHRDADGASCPAHRVSPQRLDVPAYTRSEHRRRRPRSNKAAASRFGGDRSRNTSRPDMDWRCQRKTIAAHPIPIVPRKVLHSRRSLAVGDAAGLANPITGEGMTYAFTSGALAAQAARTAVDQGSTLSAFREYDARCKTEMLNDLRAAALLSPILHRLVGVVDTRKFFENFHERGGDWSRRAWQSHKGRRSGSCSRSWRSHASLGSSSRRSGEVQQAQVAHGGIRKPY